VPAARPRVDLSLDHPERKSLRRRDPTGLRTRGTLRTPSIASWTAGRRKSSEYFLGVPLITVSSPEASATQSVTASRFHGGFTDGQTQPADWAESILRSRRTSLRSDQMTRIHLAQSCYDEHGFGDDRSAGMPTPKSWYFRTLSGTVSRAAAVVALAILFCVLLGGSAVARATIVPSPGLPSFCTQLTPIRVTTNADGVTTFDYSIDGAKVQQVVPPANLNLSAATNSQLKEYGYPPPPTGTASRQAWLSGLADRGESLTNIDACPGGMFGQ
jgi:hypothetical protein